MLGNNILKFSAKLKIRARKIVITAHIKPLLFQYVWLISQVTLQGYKSCFSLSLIPNMTGFVKENSHKNRLNTALKTRVFSGIRWLLKTSNFSNFKWKVKKEIFDFRSLNFVNKQRIEASLWNDLGFLENHDGWQPAALQILVFGCFCAFWLGIHKEMAGLDASEIEIARQKVRQLQCFFSYIFRWT